MAAALLTHHHIAEVALPFVRSGWTLDLAASDRAAGRLRFGPRRAEDGRHAWTVWLDWMPEALTRTTVADGGTLAARLCVHGGTTAARLTRLDEVPVAAQWHFGDGYVAALHHASAAFSAPRLVRAEAAIGPLRLAIVPPGPGRRSATLTLAGDTRTQLPDDVLAVQGWAWSPLVRDGSAWRGSVRVPPGGVQARLLQGASHLAQTLAAPPAAFHARFARQRWRVLARRSVPLALWSLVLLVTGLVPALRESRESLAALLALLLPAVLLGLFVLAAESPRLELPPPPQPLRASRW